MSSAQTTADRFTVAINLAAVRRWFSAHWLDLAFLALLVAVASSLRLVKLVDIPAGLHGDEAWTGIDARRILDEGWIGVYVRSALGQPAGPMYWAAPFVAVFGETVFSIRFAMAVIGIATVPVTYLAARVMFGRTVAVFAGLLLAVGVWHLHYSRLAFPVITWPFVEMVTVLFLFLGIKTGRLYHFAIAGLFFGGGVYTYNAYPLFVVAMAVFLMAWAGLEVYQSSGRVRERLRYYVQRIVLMAVVSFVVALPLLMYAADSNNNYFAHSRLISVFETAEWRDGGLSDRATILRTSAWDFYNPAFWSGDTDEADGAGHTSMVDRVTLVLLIAGVIVLLWRWRQPASLAVLLMVLIIPIATIITTQGTYRQTLGMVPFLAILAAVPLAFWWDRSARLVSQWRYPSYAIIVGVVGLIAYLNVSFFFDEWPDTHVAGVTFNPQLVEAIEFMDSLPEDYYIYFLSDRWGLEYEPKRYLAPDRSGEDRSEEFGQRTTLTPDPALNIAYVLVGEYVGRIDEIAESYPGGERVDRGEAFQAYLLPRSEEPPDESEVARLRDATRMQDLGMIEDVLATYAAQEGGYPDTGGGVQTLCAFVDLDEGCVLREIANLPEDPLGTPGVNGYFYASDGETYTVFATRESDAFPECPQHPDFFSTFESLLCVSGP